MSLVPAAISVKVARGALLARKNSPGILFGAGVVGMVGSTVLACRATLKMDEVLSDAGQKMKKTDRALEHDDYSSVDQQHDKKVIRVQTSVKIVRLYAPAVILGGASIAALAKSHSILTQRNAALAAAYTALDKAFNEYRSRVVSKYGEEEDRNLRYGTRQIGTVDPETNEKKMITRVAPGTPSGYARFFDPTSSSWSRDPEINLFFLHAKQNYANDLLRSRGHVFLNEVYDELGLPRSKAGAVVGWILRKDGTTDNHIDFGVFSGKSQVARDFVNGHEGAILLDFNVDGLIWEEIEKAIEEL
jgi:Family of unknown function (DUF6353)